MSQPTPCLSRTIGISIKLTTFTGILLIVLDILIIFGMVSVNRTSLIVKNSFSIVNAILFSLSCTLYVFKFNQEILHNDISNLCEYYRNSDLRIRGLEIIEATEELGMGHEERFKFRDSILFRAKLKHCGLILEILFFYFNAIAYGKIYYHQGNNMRNETILKAEEVYMLNLYSSIISPLLSILFSYITVLCDNIVVVKDYVKVIRENRDKEDHYIGMLKRVVEYPLFTVLECYGTNVENEPTQ